MALYFDAFVSGGVTTPANALGAPDGVYTADGNSNNSWTARWSFPDVGGQPGGTQTITARVRKGTNTNSPSLDRIDLYQSGTLVATIFDTVTTINSTTGEDVVATFDGSLLTGGAGVALEIVTTGPGGSPNDRNAIELDAVTWDENIAAAELAGNPVTQGATSLAAAITQTHELGANSVTTGALSSAGAITSEHTLAANSVTQGAASSAGSIEVPVVLAGNSVTSGATSSTAAISQSHNIAGAQTTQAANSSTGAISQTHVVTGNNVTQGATSSAAAVGQNHQLAGSSVVQAANSSTGAFIQTHALSGAGVTQGAKSAIVPDYTPETDGTIHGHMINFVAINGGTSSEIKLSEAIAGITLATSADPVVADTQQAESTALIGVPLTGDATVSPGSDGVADIRVVVQGDMVSGWYIESAVADIGLPVTGEATVSPGSDGVAGIGIPVQGDMNAGQYPDAVIAGITIPVTGDATVSSGSEGIAGILLTMPSSPTVSPGSDGVAGIDILGAMDAEIRDNSVRFEGLSLVSVPASGQLTVSDSSGGVATVIMPAEGSLLVWTYLYNQGMAKIKVDGLVNPRPIPKIPDTFYPALDKFMVGDDARLGSVSPDDDTMQVRRDRQLEVEEERS